jgi:Fe-S-cluster containining protein
VFEEAWQNEVAESAANTAWGLLGDTLSLSRVIDLTQRAMNSTSRLIAGLLAQAPRGGVACHAGCDHCCHVNVGVTVPEALTILEYLQRTLSAPGLTQLAEHVAIAHARTHGLEATERFSPEHPCVFLQSGRCSIYEVRPLACRGMNSLDADECKTRLLDAEARATFARAGGGRLFQQPVQAARAVSAGLQLAITGIYHLDMRPLELGAAMHILLEQGASATEAWLAGGSPLESARDSPE